MKKTLIALMALAGMAVAEEWTATFSSNDKTITQDADNYSASFGTGTDNPLSLDFGLLSVVATTTGQANGGYESETSLGSAFSSAIRPNANIGAGATWTLTFTLTNNSDEAISINAVTLDTFLYNKSGDSQGDNGASHKINYTLAAGLSSASVSAFLYAQTTWDSADPTLNFNSPVILAANDGKVGGLDSVTFTLSVSENDSPGTFVGLKGAKFTGKTIPEPTTATLSLLALAGLAARRRRR